MTNELKVVQKGKELVVNSIDVAEIINQDHEQLLKMIDGFITKMSKRKKIHTEDYFTNGEYISDTNQILPCFHLTRNGCDVLANKLDIENNILFSEIYKNEFNKEQGYTVEEAEPVIESKPKLELVVDNKPLQVVYEQEVLGKVFKIYGDIDNPLFLAKDVAEWIEHKDVTSMLRNVDEDEKELRLVGGDMRPKNFLTEDGFYEVLMQSRKSIARAFKKEVKMILKSIRRDGGYIATNEEDDDEAIMAKALMVAKRKIDRQSKELESAHQVIEEQKHLVTFAKKITTTNEVIKMSSYYVVN